MFNQSQYRVRAFHSISKGTDQDWQRNSMVTMKKQKLLKWKTTGNKTKVIVDNKVVGLQEDRCLLARVIMVCKSRTEINIAEAVEVYEFSLVPRSLFASDGSMLRRVH